MAPERRAASALHFPTTNPLQDPSELDAVLPELPKGLEHAIRLELYLIERYRGGKGKASFHLDCAPGRPIEWTPGSSGHGREER